MANVHVSSLPAGLPAPVAYGPHQEKSGRMGSTRGPPGPPVHEQAVSVAVKLANGVLTSKPFRAVHVQRASARWSTLGGIMIASSIGGSSSLWRRVACPASPGSRQKLMLADYTSPGPMGWKKSFAKTQPLTTVTTSSRREGRGTSLEFDAQFAMRSSEPLQKASSTTP